MSYFSSKYLIAAKALAAKDWSHPKVLRAARHLAHDGASLQEIKSALGWTCCDATARKRLKELNIKWHNYSNRSHRGELTGLGNHGYGVDTQSYKPREVAR